MPNGNTTESTGFNEKQVRILNELNRRRDEGGEFSDKQFAILSELNRRFDATQKQPSFLGASGKVLSEGGLATSPTGQTVLRSLRIDPAVVQTGLNALDYLTRRLPGAVAGAFLGRPGRKETVAQGLERGREVGQTLEPNTREAIGELLSAPAAGFTGVGITQKEAKEIGGTTATFVADPLLWGPGVLKVVKNAGKLAEYVKLFKAGKLDEAADILKALPAPGIGAEGVPVSRIKPAGELPAGARFKTTPEGATIPTSQGERAAQKAGRLERQVSEAGKAVSPKPTLYDVLQTEPKALPGGRTTAEFEVYPGGEILSSEQSAVANLGGRGQRLKALPEGAKTATGESAAQITRPGFIGREGKTSVTFRGLQQIPGSKDAVIMVDLPNGSTVGLNEASHIVSKAEGKKIYDAIRQSDFDNVLTENKAIVAMGEKATPAPLKGAEEIGAPLLSKKQMAAAKRRLARPGKIAEGESKVTITGETPLEKLSKSGKDFGKGLIKAVKEDIKGEKLGVVADPFRNVRDFISKNQLKLTDDEIEKLTNFARKVARTEGVTADDQVRMINEWIGKNLKVPVEASGAAPTTPIETLAGKRPPRVAPKYRKETFKTLERKWKQPVGEGKPTTPGYNVNTMHPDLKDELPKIIEEFRAEFDVMRGQRLTTQQAIEGGVEFAGNLTDDAVMSLKRGDVTNASHLLGARIYVNNRLLEIADKMKGIPINASKETIGAITAENKHILSMYMKVRSLGTETARALRFMQTPISDNLINGMKNYVEVLKKIDPKAAKSLSNILDDASKLPTTTDKVLFWWYNGMLSNPFTDLANITGNTSHTLWEMMINLGNRPSSIKGMFQSLPRGLRKGWQDAKAIYNQDKEFLNKFTSPEARARYDLYPKTKLGKFGRGILPTTRLGMEDAIFSSVAKEMRIGIEAPKIARKAGISTDDVLKGVRSVIENPRLSTGTNDAAFREIAEYADKYAEYVTFRSPLKSAFAQGLQNTIWIKPFVPFARVTANIGKAGFKNSPAAILKFFQKDFKTLPLAERQDIVRRALAGTTFFAGIGSLMAAGKVEVTGSGPEDKKSRELWDKMGYKPNHIYVVNSDGSKTGVSYQNINPFNVVLAVMGNWQDQYRFGNKLTDTEKTLSEKASYALGGAAQTMTDQSFMQGISRLFDWIKYKDEKYLEDFFTQPFIPNVVGFPRNMTEYVKGEKPRYEARNWWERVKRRVGLTEGLVPTYSAYGGQKESGYERFPYFASDVKRDPLLEDLREKNVLVSVPSKRTTINNRVMTEAEYAEYVRISGDLIAQQLRRKQATIRRMNAEQAQDFVDNIVRNQREIAKNQIKRRAR